MAAGSLDMGFGSLAKVLEPAALVKEIKDDLGGAEIVRETLGLPVEKTQEHASRFDKRLWYRVGLFWRVL